MTRIVRPQHEAWDKADLFEVRKKIGIEHIDIASCATAKEALVAVRKEFRAMKKDRPSLDIQEGDLDEEEGIKEWWVVDTNTFRPVGDGKHGTCENVADIYVVPYIS